MSWLEKFIPSRIRIEGSRKRNIPEGLWTKCDQCGAVLYRAELERSLDVCPKCDHHMRQRARRRLEQFLDETPRVEIGSNLSPTDPLKFRDSKRYRDRLSQATKQSGERDALIVIRGALYGKPLVAAAFDFGFMAGSMGSVVGERFVRGVEAALEHRLPFVCFSASGGARMQESVFSLMQMAKTSAALRRLSDQGLPYISVLTDPTTGGVSASLGMLGDLNIAEPNALIGFAGPRVIEQTVKEKLPEGFQRSEFLLSHGVLDMIVHRREMRGKIARVLSMLSGEEQRPSADLLQPTAQLPTRELESDAPVADESVSDATIMRSELGRDTSAPSTVESRLVDAADGAASSPSNESPKAP